MAKTRSERIAERISAPPYDEEMAWIEKYAGNGHFELGDDRFIELLCGTIVGDRNKDVLYEDGTLAYVRIMQQSRKPVYNKLIGRLRDLKVWIPDFENAIAETTAALATRPTPQPSTELMAKTFAPPVMYVESFLPHGMTLLAGKRKKGKSTLALEVALSIAVGRRAFGRLNTLESKVLYVSLEDNDFLVNKRLKEIQANFTGHHNLQLLYTFPRLDDVNVLPWLREYAEDGYRVFFIDVLGRVLPGNKKERRNTDDYQEFTELLGPLQQFANTHRIALVLLDHVRKAEADDPFDAIHGSGAKTGVADHLMVYERRFKEKDATIQLSSRLLGDDTLKITMVDGHLEFLGMGDDFELNQEESRVTKVIQEENRPMAVKDIMQAIGVPFGQYPRFRVAVNRMFHKGILGKTKRGLYTVGTIRQEEDDEGPVPF